MKCPDCGASIKDNGAFCSYCGAKLPVEEKKDEKKREFRFHFNDSEASVRRAEIRKEREAQKLQAQAEEAKRQEEERKRLMEEQARQNKRSLIVLGVMLAVALIMFLLTK